MEAHKGMHTMEPTSTDCDQVGNCVDCKNDFRSLCRNRKHKLQVLIVAGGMHSELWLLTRMLDTRTDCNGGLPGGGLRRLERTSTGCDGDG